MMSPAAVAAAAAAAAAAAVTDFVAAGSATYGGPTPLVTLSASRAQSLPVRSASIAAASATQSRALSPARDVYTFALPQGSGHQGGHYQPPPALRSISPTRATPADVYIGGRLQPRPLGPHLAAFRDLEQESIELSSLAPDLDAMGGAGMFRSHGTTTTPPTPPLLSSTLRGASQGASSAQRASLGHHRDPTPLQSPGPITLGEMMASAGAGGMSMNTSMASHVSRDSEPGASSSAARGTWR